jgi:hypothetical protein
MNAPRAHLRTYSLALVAAAIALGASGCGSGGGSTPSGNSKNATDFIRSVTTQFSRGQSGRLWDTLIPADKAVVSRHRYMSCAGNEGFDLQKFKVLEAYADTIDVGGKATAAMAVSVQVTSDDGITTATMHAVSVGGTWHWILPASDYAAYKQGKCPAH